LKFTDGTVVPCQLNPESNDLKILPLSPAAMTNVSSGIDTALNP